MSLSRKDYEAIADAILNVKVRWGSDACEEGKETEVDNALQELQERLEAYFAEENPRFDGHRFSRACWASDSARLGRQRM